MNKVTITIIGGGSGGGRGGEGCWVGRWWLTVNRPVWSFKDLFLRPTGFSFGQLDFLFWAIWQKICATWLRFWKTHDFWWDDLQATWPVTKVTGVRWGGRLPPTLFKYIVVYSLSTVKVELNSTVKSGNLLGVKNNKMYMICFKQSNHSPLNMGCTASLLCVLVILLEYLVVI